MIKLLYYLKKYRVAAIAALVMMLIELAVELAQPYLISKIIDNGIQQGDLSVVWLWGGVLVGSAVVAFAAGIASSFFASHASLGFGYDLREKLYEKVQTFSYAVFNRFATSSLITRLTGDVTQVQDTVFMSLRFMTRVPLVVIGSMIMAVIVNPRLGLLLVVMVPVLLIVVVWMIKKAALLFRNVQRRLDAVNGVIQENLTGIRLIRVFVRMGHEIERFAGFSGKLMKGTISALRLTETTMPFMLLMMNVCIIAVLWFGRVDIASGNATVGEVVAVINYLLRTIGAMSALSWILVTFSRASASAQRLNEVFNTEDTSETEQTKSLSTSAPSAGSMKSSHFPQSVYPAKKQRAVQGAVEFRSVGFSYPNSEITVLDNITFTAKAGSVLPLWEQQAQANLRWYSLFRVYTQRIKERYGLMVPMHQSWICPCCVVRLVMCLKRLSCLPVPYRRILPGVRKMLPWMRSWKPQSVRRSMKRLRIYQTVMIHCWVNGE